MTPFRSDKVDYQALEAIIEHTISGGVDFLVSLGTTGETSTLSQDEAIEVLRFTIRTVNGRKPLVTGMFGGNCTHHILERLREFDPAGIDALLLASPAYNKPPQEGIYRHYMAIAEVSPLPIIIYNVPGRTASNLSADTTLRLAHASDKFIGIKEASTNLMQGMQILKRRPDRFRVWSGDDPTSLGLLAAGGHGVISVLGNAFPIQFGSMVRHALESNFPLARHYNEQLLDLHRWMYIDGNPAGIKAVLAMQGLCTNEVRLPLTPLQEENVLRLKEEINRCGLGG